MIDRSRLATEQRNPASANLDRLDSLGIVDLINRQDALIAAAVRRCRREIAAAIELIAEALASGGRLIYVGAGTSGRLGVLDASECPPTYGTQPWQVQGVIAGGHRALVRSVEGAEDRADAGAAAMDKRRVKAGDVVVGIAACGVTPFVRAAMSRARARGAKAVFVTCSPQPPDSVDVDVVIAAVVGPEVVTGSTRMKAGTATKLVLNTLSTGAMVRLGKVYGNLMVDLRATNAKLRDRSERIVMAAAAVDRPAARRLLKRCDGLAKAAILAHLAGVRFPAASDLLEQAKGNLRSALALAKANARTGRRKGGVLLLAEGGMLPLAEACKCTNASSIVPGQCPGLAKANTKARTSRKRT